MSNDFYSSTFQANFVHSDQNTILSFMGLSYEAVEMGDILKAENEMLITSGAVSCIAGAALLKSGDVYIFHTKGDTFSDEVLGLFLSNKLAKGVIGGCVWLPSTREIIDNNENLELIELPNDKGVLDFHVVYDPETRNIYYGYLNKNDRYWEIRSIFEGTYDFDL